MNDGRHVWRILIRARRPDHDREGSYERRKPKDEGEEKLENNLGASSWAVDTAPRSLLDRGIIDVFQIICHWHGLEKGSDSEESEG